MQDVLDYKISLAQVKCWLPCDLSQPSTLYIQFWGAGGKSQEKKLLRYFVESCSNDKA